MKEVISWIGKQLFYLPILTTSLITVVLLSTLGRINTQSQDSKLSKYYDKFDQVSVVFRDNFSISSNKLRAYVSVKSVVVKGNIIDINDERLLVFLPMYEDYNIGEILILKGNLSVPEEFDDGFSYVNYLRRKDVHYLMYRPYVERTGEYDINPFMKALYTIRVVVISKIERYLSEPHSSLVSGILIGVGNTMPKGFSGSLRDTGTTHIIAASGYNVTLISGFLVENLKFLNRKWRYVVAVGFVWVFVVISGGSIPVLRAAIMGTITMVSMLFGRNSNIMQSIVLSVLVILLIDKYALESISFQLSFASTIGLIYIVPILKKWLFFIPEWLEESFLVSLAAIISTFPITVGNFGAFSTLGLLANMLVIPTIEIIMVLSSIFIVIPGLFKGLLVLISSVLWVPIEYFIKIVDLLSQLPFSTMEIESFRWYMGAIWYLVLILIVLLNKGETYEKYC